MTLTPGARLGPFEIVALLGVGGMGEVYRATDTNLKRQVAIKVLPSSVAADADRLARFQREAEVLASLNHPNIAHIHGLEKSDGITALVMELVEGPTLADRIAQGPIALADALPIAKQIAEAIAAAHEQGIIHRDLKPANIKVRPDGTVKVLDFGLAKALDRLTKAEASARQTITSPALTQLGIILGTAPYMSPEQARGRAVDKRSDVWAFGCVLYEMLAGRPAFSGETIQDTVAQVIEREPDWKALPARMPAPVRRVIRSCLQKDPQHRLPSIDAARTEFRRARTATTAPRRIMTAVVAASVVTVLAMGVAKYGFTRRGVEPTSREPVTVLIADIDNRTGDATFDRALEPMLRLALEDAAFINAYDRSRFRVMFGTAPPEKLDEAAARQAAMRQAVSIVLSGSIARDGDGYELSIKGAQPISSKVALTAKAHAANKNEVLGTIVHLAATVRKALGEKTSEADQLFAMRSITAGSLDAIGEYAAGIELQAKGMYEQAIQKFRKAVEIDPNFAPAYNSLSVNLKNVGSIEESEKYAKDALRHLDSMTDRERFATRANYYRITGDLQKCIKEYGELLARYSADPVAHNNRALCLGRLRDYRGAIDEIRQALKILPNHMTYHANLALFADYAGDFATAEREIRSLLQPGAGALQALPLSLIGQARLHEAAESYKKMMTMGAFGVSFGAAGLGDLALYEGRFLDAAAIFDRAAAAELKAGHLDQAAGKLNALAYARLSSGQDVAAVAAADNALANSKALSVRFLSARILVDAGAVSKAQSIAASLAADIAMEPQVYGKIISGQIALKQRDLPQAIKTLIEANSIIDTWIGHFELGRAYLEGRAYAQADSEFDLCLRRRGEALLLVDEDPTYGHFPLVYYYLGRAREGLQTVGFADVYREYLKIRGTSTDDPLLAEVRRRADAHR